MEFFGILLGLLRVLGGFPYVEERGKRGQVRRARGVGDQERGNWTAQEDPGRFKESRFWIWWSRFVYLGVLAYLVEFFLEICKGIRKFIQTDTMYAANVVKDALNLVGLLSLFSYLLLKRTSALELVTELRKLRRYCHLSRKNFKGHLKLALAMGVFAMGNVVVLESYVSGMVSKPTVYMASDILEVALYFLIVSFTMNFYYCTICLVGDLYDEISSSLSLLRNSDSNATRIATSSALHPKRVETHEPIATPRFAGEKTLLDAIPYEPDKRFFKEQLVRGATERLAQLHHVQRLLHRYMGFPITATLFITVATTILSFFYISFWVFMDVETRVLALGYTVISLLPSIVLFNVPPVLQCRVSELQLLLNELRRLPSLQNYKYSIDEVDAVLQEFPGFEMCRIFTLGRARMIDISSFMATYVIILLQFRASEGAL